MSSKKTTDVVLIGGGIMSATLASLISHLQPDWSIVILERLDDVAQESSNPWNNAGTGHSALCELNYTPEKPDGTVDASKAIQINEQFQVSRQYWAHLVRDGRLDGPRSFISATPHMTFVTGENDVDFLKRRFEVLRKQPLFSAIEYSEDSRVINSWAPLLMQGRKVGEPFAATREVAGTDVDFGSLTRQLFDTVVDAGAYLRTSHEVRSLKRQSDGTWNVGYRNLVGRATGSLNARFVFVGAGGWALPLLQKARIPEVKGYGVFPISGEFLRTDNPKLTAEHHAKVYSQAKVGAPPMSVPHLDARFVDGQQSLLFGPYAGFSPRFLKKGSLLDLVKQVRPGNILPMLAVARHNPALLKYLIGQLTASKETKFAMLKEFVPTAKPEDWYTIVAGQRAQVMRKDPDTGGVLQFGTEIISTEDGSMAGLLGASPGASTAVHIMLDVLRRCFPDHIQGWAPELTRMIPSYGQTLNDKPELAEETMRATAEVLDITR